MLGAASAVLNRNGNTGKLDTHHSHRTSVVGRTLIRGFNFCIFLWCLFSCFESQWRFQQLFTGFSLVEMITVGVSQTGYAQRTWGKHPFSPAVLLYVQSEEKGKTKK